MRTITIKSNRLVDVFNKKNELQKNIGDRYTLIEKEQQELNKLGIKMQKEKEKAVVEVKKLKLDLSEFEYIATFDVKDDDVILNVADYLEEYTDAMRKKLSE